MASQLADGEVVELARKAFPRLSTVQRAASLEEATAALRSEARVLARSSDPSRFEEVMEFLRTHKLRGV